MPSTLVDLRPNRRLLDHDFEGYKLNLQALPHFTHDLPSAVDKVFPDEVQYSFVHAKLFALHNHLVLDHWDYTHNYYYIDNNQQVRHISFEASNQSFQNIVVYDVPAHEERKSGHFNLCLSFPSNELAVISDGTGYLHIVDTFPRNRPASRNQSWQTLHSSLVLGEDKYYIIVDTRIQEKNNTKILHCLLQSVEQNETHFYSVLSWVTFELYDYAWKQTSLRQLQGKGIVHYAAIETSCTALYIASDNPFKFTADSEKDINEATQEEPQKIIYTWLQTEDDITMSFKLQENYNKQLLHIDVKPTEIKVIYAGNIFVNGRLKHAIDSELTTWNVQENGQVDLLLTKSDNMLWEDLIEGGDKSGEQIMDACLVEETHRRLAHLCSETEVSADQFVPGVSTEQLEECDAASEEDTVLVRIDAKHETTHRVPLSVHHYLFSLHVETQEVPALVLRQDVDACIWQPYALLVNSDTWPVKHQGTLNAFGYIQSSKQNRKFLTCPPNFSYSVVCESSRHIFVYQNKNQDFQLRKRTGGTVRNVKIGQQHVFNVERYGEVLGIDATNDYLFVLTENSLLAIGVE